MSKNATQSKVTRKRSRATKAKSRIYWREQGGDRRAYADFRNVGGGREALVDRKNGDTRATTDPEVAEKLVADRLTELLGKKRDKAFGARPETKLGDYVAYHLVQKAKSGKYSETWLADSERMLTIAIEHFSADRELSAISVSDMQGYANALGTRPNGRGGTLGGGAIRHHLNVLSSVYKRAQTEGRVALGYNPVALLMDKPAGNPEEAKWLLVHEGALLLESARKYVPKRPEAALPFIYPLIATYLLTGGRESEVLGLEVQDINFDNATLTFRPNVWRRLKTKGSHRTIPLWPQLAGILKEYLRTSGRKNGLVFPSPFLDKPGMVTDFRKPLDAIAERTGLWKSGDVRCKALRHTYTAARLQTLENGKPVALFTVSRELGHANTKLVEEVYGHVGNAPHRSEVVEYRVTQHRAKLKPYLTLLKSA
jgi:integrase